MFVMAGIAERVVVTSIVEDVDPNEPASPTVILSAPVPENRRDTQNFFPSRSLSVIL